MRIAFDTACWVVGRFGMRPPLSEDQVDDLIDSLGLRLCDAPASLPVPAFLMDHTIGLRRGLCMRLRVWHKTHELGHYLLHAGDQTEVSDACIMARQEKQADCFAGWLLVGNGWRRMPAWQVAEEWHLPESRVAAWLAERERELG